MKGKENAKKVKKKKLLPWFHHKPMVKGHVDGGRGGGGDGIPCKRLRNNFWLLNVHINSFLGNE